MKKYIKISILTLFVMTSVSSISAQINTSYFMYGSVERYNLNAALTPDRGYIPIPGLSFTADMSSNFLQLSNFVYRTDAGLVTYMHNSVPANEFLSKLPNMNNLGVNFRDRILGYGAYLKRGFISFNIDLRSETNLNIPKEFFELTKTLGQGKFDLKGMNVNTHNYLEVGFGYSFPVYEGITVGVRVKFLAGLAYANVNIDKMDVDLGENAYTANLSGTIQSNITGYDFSGLTGKVKLDDYMDYLGGGNFKGGNISSFGFAIDAGVEWILLNDQLKLSAAVNDFGYNFWNQANSYHATIDDIMYSFKGFDFANNEVDFEKTEDIMLSTMSPKGDLTKRLNMSVNVGAEYTFFKDLLGVGVLYNMKNYSTYSYNQVMVAVNFRPANWFSMAVSKSVINTNLGVFGLALNIHPAFINFFIGVDYIAFQYAKSGAISIPLNQNSLSLSFGLSIPLGRRTF